MTALAPRPPLPGHRDLVDGRRSPAADALPGTLDDPVTGAPLEARRASAPAAVEAALAAADALHANGDWRRAGLEVRAAALERLAGALERRAAAIAALESLDTGIPVALTSAIAASLGGQVRGTVEAVRAAAPVRALPAEGRHVEQRLDPRGPAVVLAPWNAPAPVIVGRAAMALALGCPVIVKPSEWAPRSAQLVADAVEDADLPSGAFALVHGDGAVGAALAADARVRALSLTGGVAAGRAVAAAAAPRFAALQLELGGTNPAIVRADADVGATAAALAAGIVKLNGQWCEAPGRIAVHRSVHDDLVHALGEALAAVPAGDCLHPDTRLGPLGHRVHRDRIAAAVDRLAGLGATVLVAGEEPPLGGWFMAPRVVLGAAPGDALEEIFGPVVVVHPVEDDGEALRVANLAPDGLAGYVFSADQEAALALGRELRGGEIRVNGTSLLDLAPGAVQGFWGQSGAGGHGVPELLRLFAAGRVVGVDDPSLPV